jgi:hypothetical protein
VFNTGEFGGPPVSGVGPVTSLFTLELQFFTSREYSIDVSTPIASIIWESIETHGFVFSTDAFFAFNLGSGTARFVAGPGVGFSVFHSTAGGVRIPAELGLEVTNRRLGFKILARPWAEFDFGSVPSPVGGGVLTALVLSWYASR